MTTPGEGPIVSVPASASATGTAGPVPAGQGMSIASLILGIAGLLLSVMGFGFFPALAVLFLIAAMASPEFNLKEVLVLMVVMGIFAWAVFIWMLGLPYPLIGAH